MKEQVLTISQMQELIDMGVDVSKASMCWSKFKNDPDFSLQAMSQDAFEEQIRSIDTLYTPYDYYIIPTFTFQDMLEMLSQGSLRGSLHFNKNKFIVFMADNQFNVINETDSVSSIEAVFKMLKWCKENKYV